MARRAPRIRPGGRGPKVPARLARCTVGDWTTDDDAPPSWWVDGTDRYRQVVAFLRWSSARRRWADDHGVDRARLAEVSPIRAPRSRPP
jgi:hypothetical protein